jgi:hypothetical protein
VFFVVVVVVVVVVLCCFVFFSPALFFCYFSSFLDCSAALHTLGYFVAALPLQGDAAALAATTASTDMRCPRCHAVMATVPAFKRHVPTCPH